jgi:uncharacterized membrane protein YdjX (TVP38/TMEM64 family)
MMPLDNQGQSLHAVVLGVIAFVVITLLMLVAIEQIGVERIQSLVEDAGPLAPLVYIALKAATYVFAPLSAGPIQLSSGLLFGLWPGTFYSLLGEVIGGVLSFIIARRLGRPVVQRFVRDEGMARVDQFVNQLGGWRALVYARLFLFSVYDFISYAAGLTTIITLKQYILVSALVGFFPTFIFVAVGTGLAEDRRIIVPLYIAVGVISIAPFVIRYLMRRKSEAASNKEHFSP